MTRPPQTGPSSGLPTDLSAELMWQVLEAAEIGLLVTDAQRRIVHVNATFTRETGYTLEEVRGRSCSLLQGPRTNPADVLAMRAALDDGEPVERVVLNYRKDGSTLWYKVRIRPIRQGGEVRYFVGIQEDYSATHAAHVQLERLAYLDSLTGLGNRRAFEVQLAEHVRRRASVALVLIDLNDFKQVNDRRGHPAGDLLLEQVGRCLERTVGDVGTAFRLGGDEFAVLLPGAEVAQGQGERILCALQSLEDGTLRVGLGTAHFPDEAADSPALLRLADGRLYAHKADTKALSPFG